MLKQFFQISDLNEEIYMKQSEYFIIHEQEDKICMLIFVWF